MIEDDPKEPEVIETKKNSKFGNLPGPGPGRPKGSKNRYTQILNDYFDIWQEEDCKEKLRAYLKKNPRYIVKFADLLASIFPKTILAELGVTARPYTVMPELKLSGGVPLTFEVGEGDPKFPVSGPESEA